MPMSPATWLVIEKKLLDDFAAGRPSRRLFRNSGGEYRLRLPLQTLKTPPAALEKKRHERVPEWIYLAC